MSKSWICRTVAVAACATMVTNASARTENALPASGKQITVSVNYSLHLPLASTETADQIKVMREGRKMLYQMAVGECETLTQTIASACGLIRLNARSNLRSQRSGEHYVTMSANAQYKITLKPNS